jgi:DnaK suppressor protein
MMTQEAHRMTKPTTTAKRSRPDELRTMLEDRLYQLTRDVHGRIREARADSVNERQAIDEGETSELDAQDELEFALIQMKAETVNRIDEALRRLEEGTYGHCFECGDDIGEARLRALPFAVRCKDCEELRELAEQRERSAVQRRTVSGLLFD